MHILSHDLLEDDSMTAQSIMHQILARWYPWPCLCTSAEGFRMCNCFESALNFAVYSKQISTRPCNMKCVAENVEISATEALLHQLNDLNICSQKLVLFDKL